MNMTSKQTTWVVENVLLATYFDYNEKKGGMEEKVMQINQTECKAFSCMKCNYKAFNGFQLCQLKDHPIKEVSAMKSSFQCKRCKKETLSLNLMPLHRCNNCGEKYWTEPDMMPAKVINYAKKHSLFEQKGGRGTQTKQVKGLVKKRKLNNNNNEEPPQQSSSTDNKFQDLMNVTSKHTDRVIEHVLLAMYFEYNEEKEIIEEKVMEINQTECKAFSCLKCNYKAFTINPLCQTKGHPLKEVSAMESSFQCKRCKNQNLSLNLLPLHRCNNCGEKYWTESDMMQHGRKVESQWLCIGGEEKKITNSPATDASLDRYMPDDG